MGRKGVSKRKPKKTNSDSKDNKNHGSSNGSSVQSLVNAREAPLNRAGASPSAGSSKKDRKGR
jgi:hypothetical protein